MDSGSVSTYGQHIIHLKVPEGLELADDTSVEIIQVK